MFLNCREQVELLSTAYALLPGTVVAAGTCSGIGARRAPQLWKKAGDVVRVKDERTGSHRERHRCGPGERESFHGLVTSEA
jgi:2-keto-4-pentenoate hydratase/2-oxohepta-3-ene-1,7-dioic acid hydratase in catechol pathway